MQLYALEDYVTQARVMLQDTVAPYRYDDESLVTTLNIAFYEVFRLRPDFITDGKYQTRSKRRADLNNFGAPVFEIGEMQDTVPVPPAYKSAFVYFMVGYAQLRDTSDTSDTRASAFIAKWTGQLLALPT